MKFLHIADLHIGKMLHKFSMLDDQRKMLAELREIAHTEQVDAVLIAGDVYQRNTPAPEAMTAFSDFLAGLVEDKLPVYLISGNHDSAERVAYLSEIARISGVYIAPPDCTQVTSYPLQDAFGELEIHLLPFCTPMEVRRRYPDSNIETYQDAVGEVLRHHRVDTQKRNILVCHQFLVGASVCDSEELAIGGLDAVSSDLFAQYDYVALGHLHGPQQVGRETVRYAGSPLKYSFSERTQKKSATIVDIQEKGHIIVKTVPIHQPHEMTELRGTFDELMQEPSRMDFTSIVLTDEFPPPDALRRLRTIFPNLLVLRIENSKMSEERLIDVEERQQQDMMTLLRDFYAMQNQGAGLTETQEKLAISIFEKMDAEGGDAL